MTRPTRTRQELKGIELLTAKLAALGHVISIDESVTDAPDLVAAIDGRRTGIELTTLTLQTYEKWWRQHGELGRPRELRISNRPSAWLEERIKSKTEKIATYRASRNLDQVWLVAHVGDLPAFGNDEGTVQHFEWACQSASHDFDEIWLVGEKGHVVRLWWCGKPALTAQPMPIPDLVIHRSVEVQLTNGVNYIDLGDSAPDDDGGLRARFLRAAYFNDLKTVRYCCRLGLNVDLKDDRGNTALRYAAGRGNLSIVKYLLSIGANKKIDFGGAIPLSELCARRGFDAVAELLR